MQCDMIDVPATSPGVRVQLAVLRFGTVPGGPKAYIQAGLHAGEVPGMLAADRLRTRLADLERQGRVVGEIVLVPMANPIGVSQRLLGAHQGRFHLGTGTNFNREFPDVTDAVAGRVASQLTSDMAVNHDLIKIALRAAIAAVPAVTAVDHLKRQLVALAVDADTVLDLHCDAEAVMHLYTTPAAATAFQPLAALLGACAMLVAETSGGHPFDEAVSQPWTELARRFPDRPMPPGCLSTTVELRGQSDVTAAHAAADADAIVRFLALRGHVRCPAVDVPAACCEVTPFDGCEALAAPCPGLIVYAVPVGARLAIGDLVADIVDPVVGSVTPVRATAAGVLFARSSGRMAETGQRIGKIAGSVPFRVGPLLSP